VYEKEEEIYQGRKGKRKRFRSVSRYLLAWMRIEDWNGRIGRVSLR